MYGVVRLKSWEIPIQKHTVLNPEDKGSGGRTRLFAMRSETLSKVVVYLLIPFLMFGLIFGLRNVNDEELLA